VVSTLAGYQAKNRFPGFKTCLSNGATCAATPRKNPHKYIVHTPAAMQEIFEGFFKG
jgi:hypothetical protein